MIIKETRMLFQTIDTEFLWSLHNSKCAHPPLNLIYSGSEQATGNLICDENRESAVS